MIDISSSKQFLARSATALNLTDAARQGSKAYTTQYLLSLRQLVDDAERNETLVSAIECINTQEVEEAIKIGLLYNDLAVVRLTETLGERYVCEAGPELHYRAGEEVIEFHAPQEIIDEMAPAMESGRIFPGVIVPYGEALDKLLSDAAPLIMSGRLIFQPKRIIAYDLGDNSWVVGSESQESLSALWPSLADNYVGDRLKTESSINASDFRARIQGTYAQIALPYLTGVNLNEYNMIMDDNQDLVVEFRSAAKRISTETLQMDETTRSEYINDAVCPRVAKINRSYNRIANSSALKAGGAAVASATLTLASYLSGGALSAALALAGSAGAISAVKELADRRDRLGQVKDDPLYLLWKLRQARASDPTT